MSYRVLVKPCYSTGTIGGAEVQPHYLTDSDLPDAMVANPGNRDYAIIEYETADDAQAAIDQLTEGTYHLSHGEMGGPEYEIVGPADERPADCRPVEADEMPHCQAVALEGVPEGIRKAVECCAVDYQHNLNDGCQLWTSNERDPDHEGVLYVTAFAARAEAVQAAGDDLSNVDWDHATYWRYED